MKRIISLMIIACLLLCACGAAPEETVAPTTTQQPTETTEATTEATTVPVVTEPSVSNVNPLTGEALDAPYTGRPAAVSVNNIKACLPQFGISQADMIYEIEAEGGITRLLAIFSDFTDIGTIGPVRSARTFFNNVSASYDIPLIHCGGSSAATKGRYDKTHHLEKWEHIDQMTNGSYFFRDKDRLSSGYALEHTLFTTGEDMTKVLTEKKLNVAPEGGVNYGLQFADDVTLNGQAANKIKVSFRGKKTTSFTYDAQAGLYKASQYGKEHVDAGNNKETLAYKNVFVLLSEQTLHDEGKYTRSYYDLIGEGNGYFACNGQMISIKWSRKTVTDPFVYTMEDGTPLTLGVGTSYVAVVDIDAPKVTCE